MLEGDAAEKFVLIHSLPGGEISDYIYTGRGSESLEAACDFKLYLYIMCLQGSALDMSQKQGCKVQIKPLTKEVTNYQLIRIAFKLLSYSEILCESLVTLEKIFSGGLKYNRFGLQVICVVRM